MKRICKNERCKAEFEAKPSDVKRGWGLYCSKRCKAVVQEKITHQYANFMKRKSDFDFDDGFDNAHQFSNEE